VKHKRKVLPSQIGSERGGCAYSGRFDCEVPF
jgi:hypothetical protein